MRDYINRQDAIEEIARRDTTDGTVKVFGGKEVIDILNELPSAQPDKDMIHLQKEQAYMQGWADREMTAMPSAQPEIIRCEDCKHYDGRPCGIVDWYNTADDFCSKGERRTDE